MSKHKIDVAEVMERIGAGVHDSQSYPFERPFRKSCVPFDHRTGTSGGGDAILA